MPCSIHNWLAYTENFTKAAPRLPVANNVYKLDLNSEVNFIVGFEAIQKKPGWEKFFAAEFQLCQWTFGASKKHWLLKRVLDRIFDYYETETPKVGFHYQEHWPRNLELRNSRCF